MSHSCKSSSHICHPLAYAQDIGCGLLLPFEFCASESHHLEESGMFITEEVCVSFWPHSVDSVKFMAPFESKEACPRTLLNTLLSMFHGL